MNLQEYVDAVKEEDIARSRRNALAQKLINALLKARIWTEEEIHAARPPVNKRVFQSDGEFWEIEWSPSCYGPTIGRLQKLTADNIPSL